MFNLSVENISRRCRLAALGAILFTVPALVAASIPSSVAAAGVGAVQYNYSIPFTAGQTSASKTVTPITPTGKVFVIETISMYRYPASTSTLQTFLGVNSGYIALDDITGKGDLYPAATSKLTAYVPAGMTAYVNLYRTGTPLPAESAYITLTGHLAAQ